MDIGAIAPDEFAERLPAARWRAGEAAPAGALPGAFGGRVGASVACIGILSLGFAASAQGVFPVGAAGAAAAVALETVKWIAILAPKGVTEPLAMVASEVPSPSLAVRGGQKFAFSFGAEIAERVKVLSLIVSLPFRALDLTVEKFKEIRCDDDRFDKGFFKRPFDAFDRLADRFVARLRERSEDLSEASRCRLSEKGAWLQACDAMMAADPAKAVEIWIAKPFNPDWTVRLREGSAKALGRKMSFRQAIEEVAANSQSWPSDAKACSDLLRLMSVAVDKAEIDAVLGSAPAQKKSSPRL